MTVRGTENYVFYIDKVLGAGSTGTVYFGRHKRKGDPCAVKLFTRTDSANKVRVKQNEIDFMRMLSHTNIVRFLAIEDDSRTKETVLVMELCSEGSVQKLLAEPENAFGFQEDLFFSFFIQIVKGLEYLTLHGVIHRDVKPGNILCCKSEDGRMLFKLTDFGATRELACSGNVNALFGTEEYLYPDTYRCVLIDKVPVPSELDTHTEIWSIGVMLYHVVTGHLPFQAFGGRNNRDTMYRIISTKAKGIISGIQSESSGEIQWKNDLPDTCCLSRGLKDKLVPIIAGVVEKDATQQWTFDEFFPKCEYLSNSVVVIAFNVISATYIRAYLHNSNRSVKALKLELSKQTAIKVEDLVLIYGSKVLSDNATDLVPVTTEECPIILASELPWTNFQEIKPALPQKPVMSDSEPTLAVDAVWSRDASAFCWRCSTKCENLSRVQIFCQQFQNILIEPLSMEIGQLRSVELELTFDVTELKARHICTDVQHFLGELGSKSEKHKELDSFTHQCVRHLNILVRELQGLVVQVAVLKEKTLTKTAALKTLRRVISIPVSDCDERRCIYKNRKWYERSRQVYEKFASDKKRQLSYNEDQIHKYERIKVVELMDMMLSELDQHCVKVAQKQHRETYIWFQQVYKKVKDDVNEVKNLQSSLRQEVRHLLEQTSEVEAVFKQNVEKLTVLTSKPAKSSKSLTTLLSSIFSSKSGEHSTRVHHSRSLNLGGLSLGTTQPILTSANNEASALGSGENSGSSECSGVNMETSSRSMKTGDLLHEITKLQSKNLNASNYLQLQLVDSIT